MRWRANCRSRPRTQAAGPIGPEAVPTLGIRGHSGPFGWYLGRTTFNVCGVGHSATAVVIATARRLMSKGPSMPSSITRDLDDSRVAAVLAGLRFPALTWQLVAQADYYGADVQTRSELAALPIGEYPNFLAVLTKLREVRSVRNALYKRHPRSGRSSSRPPRPGGR